MNARCVDIKCPLKGLDSKASIVLRSRLWNSTFLEVSPLPCHFWKVRVLSCSVSNVCILFWNRNTPK